MKERFMSVRSSIWVRSSMSLGVALGAAFILAGCHAPVPPPQARADYSVTLDKYYEGRPLCVWQDSQVFPMTDVTPEKSIELGLPALADAGLLTRRVAEKTTTKGAKTYDLSPTGNDAFMKDIFKPGGGNFCYGRRKVASIDSAKRNSQTTELVNYHYSIPEPAAWASNPALDTAFPQVATEIVGTHMGQATMLDTTDGWEISGTPATIVPITTQKPPSELSKARSLLHLRKKKE
jgi:hypothetical protein